MAYRDHYDNPTQFATSVYLQAQYQTSHKIIAINGVSEYDMFSFEGTLNQSFLNIKQILPTPTTTSKTLKINLSADGTYCVRKMPSVPQKKTFSLDSPNCLTTT
jgi:hypothetical protein